MTPISFDFLAEQGLDRLGGALVPRCATAAALCSRRLLGPQALEQALDPLCRQQSGAPLRALASLWSKHYFHRLVPPVVLTQLLAHRDWPLHLGECGVLLDPAGLPESVALPEARAACAAPDCPFARFAPLVDDHLAPLIQQISALARLPQRVLWGNAAGYFRWAVHQLAEDPTAPPGCAAAGLAVLNSPLRPDGSANPMFDPMRLHEGPRGAQACRKTCCLLYQLPEREKCSHCPLHCAEGRCGG